MGIKKTSIIRYFTLYGVKLCLLPFIIMIAALCFFILGAFVGIIRPANYQELKVLEKKPIIETADIVTPEMFPEDTKYMLASKDNGAVIDNGNMTQQEINNVATFYKTGNKPFDFNNTSFMSIQRQADVCIVQYSVTAKFTINILNLIVPYPEITLTIVCLVIYILIVLFFSKRKKSYFNNELEKVLTKVSNIENNDLDFISEENRFIEFQKINNGLNKMSNALKVSIKKQISTDQIKAQQISALAHDIKIPLTIIRGNIELFDMFEINEKQKEFVDDIHSATMEIEKYISNLIEVSKMNKYSLVIKQNIDIFDLIDDISAEFRAYICSGQNIEFLIEKNLENMEIFVDVNLVKRAVLNILTNAFEHSGKSSNKITLILEKIDNNILFEVKDEGNGFSSDALKYGTNLFYMQDENRSSGHYGIGLNFAYQVASLHKGKLVCKNHEKGAVVDMTISID